MSATNTGAPPAFDAPFRLDSGGLVVVADQDSSADIGSCVYNVIVCPQGAKLNAPTFGNPSDLFDNLPIDTKAIEKAVNSLEPRANTTVIQEQIQRVQALQPVQLDVTSEVSA